MSNERPDKFLAWRGPLEQPDALPDQRLDDKEAAWERLNGRLLRYADQGVGVVPAKSVFRKRSGWKRRPNRYAIAAALLLWLSVPVTLLYRGMRPAAGGNAGGAGTGHPSTGWQGTQDDIAKAPRQMGASQDVSAAIKSNVARARTASGGKNIESGFPAGGFREHRVVERRVMTKPEQRPVALVTTPPVTTPAFLSDSGARLAVITTPVRKSLRVVSINEIEHPGTTGPAVTAQSLATHFRITLNPRSGALSPESALQERGSALLEIKLSP